MNYDDFYYAKERLMKLMHNFKKICEGVDRNFKVEVDEVFSAVDNNKDLK